ncbi:hypothetical protein CEXT_340821 [Caerostris extrusa]|uniref:Uncharacterized protein n=1 Tax=Caerostris extrusa TaxID=172846 RepID=A0AAV4S5F4_CAEEX|nr:hypothetical protein CEXT_340821 [Caerostris extrusa]
MPHLSTWHPMMSLYTLCEPRVFNKDVFLFIVLFKKTLKTTIYTIVTMRTFFLSSAPSRLDFQGSDCSARHRWKLNIRPTACLSMIAIIH